MVALVRLIQLLVETQEMTMQFFLSGPALTLRHVQDLQAPTDTEFKNLGIRRGASGQPLDGLIIPSIVLTLGGRVMFVNG